MPADFAVVLLCTPCHASWRTIGVCLVRFLLLGSASRGACRHTHWKFPHKCKRLSGGMDAVLTIFLSGVQPFLNCSLLHDRRGPVSWFEHRLGTFTSGERSLTHRREAKQKTELPELFDLLMLKQVHLCHHTAPTHVHVKRDIVMSRLVVWTCKCLIQHRHSL